jgi:glutamine synthetase
MPSKKSKSFKKDKQKKERTMGTSAKDIIKRIKDEEIEWVDVRFTDPKGKWQHLTMCAGVIGEDELEDGLMFDGSSIEGWKAINESDMILKPDLEAVYIDPFSATPMMIIFCDIVEPSTGELYSRDPRSTAKRAEAYLKTTGIGDTVYVGPEAEFFMFDDVRFENSYSTSYYKIDDIELPTNSGTKYEGGNMGHRPRAKGGYFPVAPVDSAMDIRGEMVSTMLEMGLPCDKHHHEVAAAQHELGLTFGTLTETADRMQIYKYFLFGKKQRLAVFCLKKNTLDPSMVAHQVALIRPLASCHFLLDLPAQADRW